MLRKPGILAFGLLAVFCFFSISWAGDNSNTDTGIVRVIAWGQDEGDRLAFPFGLSDVEFVSAGFSHNLALKKDGTVVAWGGNRYGQSTVPEGLRDVKAVAAGGSHSLALKKDGTVVSWGRNHEGRLTIPEGLDDVQAIAAGGHHALALKADSSIVAWGDDLLGQSTVPDGLNDVAAIAAGNFHNLALKEDGTVVAWGNESYELSTVPDGLTDVIAIAAGGSHNLALRKDGTVVAWGLDNFGQSTVPEGLSGAVSIAAGGSHNLALKEDGTVAAWGDNKYGQSSVPAGSMHVTAVAAGGGHSLALVKSGEDDVEGEPQHTVNDLATVFEKSGFSVREGEIINGVPGALHGAHFITHEEEFGEVKVGAMVFNTLEEKGKRALESEKERMKKAIAAEGLIDSLRFYSLNNLLIVVAGDGNFDLINEALCGLDSGKGIETGPVSIEKYKSETKPEKREWDGLAGAWITSEGPAKDLWNLGQTMFFFRENGSMSRVDISREDRENFEGCYRTTDPGSLEIFYAEDGMPDNREMFSYGFDENRLFLASENEDESQTMTLKRVETTLTEIIPSLIPEEADAETFEYLGLKYGRDKNHVYAHNRILDEGPDPSSVQLLGEEHITEDGFYFKPLYLMDQNDVYVIYWEVGKLEDVDPESFVLLGAFYAKDAEHVYFGAEILHDADPSTFHHIEETYAGDANSIYRSGRKLEGRRLTEFLNEHPELAGRYASDVFAGGAGTKEEPYLVETAEQLDEVRNHRDRHFQQTGDIDLSPYADGEGWEPIGERGRAFLGSFDGQGFKITNLTISRHEENNVGLFGAAGGNSILRNVILQDVNVTGNKNVGGLIGFSNGRKIFRCRVTGEVSGQSSVGGLVGISYAVIEESVSAVKVSGERGVGGFAGTIRGGSIISCYARTEAYDIGGVENQGSIGGFVGSFREGNLLTCYVEGLVVVVEENGGRSGGLIGSNSDGRVARCYYDKNTTKQTDDIGNGYPRTTEQMKIKATYKGWDFNNVWEMKEGEYPSLQWEKDEIR